MASKCKYPNCDAFSRKLTGTEIRNLLGYNLTHKVCESIFIFTCRGLCPSHAARSLTDDVRPDRQIIDTLKRKWNYYVQNNFADAKGYALCSLCSTPLSADRVRHPVSLVRSMLGALYVPQKRIKTILWLQTSASGGLGTCFDCSLDSCTDCEYDDAGELILTELDRMCQADLA